jgi:hypothetical protein
MALLEASREGRLNMGLSVEDRLDIQQLYARYCHAIDGGDPEGWAATFTANGVLEAGTVRQQGGAALAEFARGLSQYKMRHWTNNLVLEPAEGGASGRCYLVAYLLGGDQPVISTTGIYHDDLVDTPEGWRFQKRSVVPD